MLIVKSIVVVKSRFVIHVKDSENAVLSDNHSLSVNEKEISNMSSGYENMFISDEYFEGEFLGRNVLMMLFFYMSKT